MTIITKPLSEKKSEKVQEPLVDDKITIDGGDVEVVGLLERRIGGATTACLFLTALLVMSCGIISGVCLYEQFGKAQVQRFFCRVPFGEKQAIMSSRPFSAEMTEEFDTYRRISSANSLAERSSYLDEEVEIQDSYEKITVPYFNGGRRSKFIHEFRTNKTCIIDLDGERCFVMPLNRTTVLPPKNLLDVIEKMRDGYYDVDTSVVRETMRVVTPAIEDRASLGTYIQRECYGYPIYKLEKVKVFKRSAAASATPSSFANFAGQKTYVLDLVNYRDLEEHEAQLPVAMA